jgi:hypothetical protein
MATMLRHVPTGDLYPLNEHLIRRDDMVEYIPPPEGATEKRTEAAVEEEVVISKPKPKAKAKKAEPEAQDDLDFGDLSDELETL